MEYQLQYQTNNHLQQMAPGDQQHGAYHIVQQGVNAPVTERQQYQTNTHIGNANSTYKRGAIRGPEYNSYVNVSKEQSLMGREPTTANYNKIPTMDYSMVELKEPINAVRDQFPNMSSTHPMYFIPSENDNNVNQYPQYGDRAFNSDNIASLGSNSYVNNIMHVGMQLEPTNMLA